MFNRKKSGSDGSRRNSDDDKKKKVSDMNSMKLYKTIEENELQWKKNSLDFQIKLSFNNKFCDYSYQFCRKDNLDKHFFNTKKSLRNIFKFSFDEFRKRYINENLKDVNDSIYFLNNIDKMQEYEFSQMVFPGPNVNKLYHIDLKYRKKLILMIFVNHIINNSMHDTIQNAIALIDQYAYCSKEKDLQEFTKSVLASVHISHKIDEFYDLNIMQLVKLAGNMYTKKEIYKKEFDIMTRLDLRFKMPVAIIFLRIIMLLFQPEKMKFIYEMAKMLIDLSLFYKVFLGLPYSLIASSAFICSFEVVNNRDIDEYKDNWLDDFQCLIGYDISDIKCVSDIFLKLFDYVSLKESTAFNIILHKFHLKIGVESTSNLVELFYLKLGKRNKITPKKHCVVCNYMKSKNVICN